MTWCCGRAPARPPRHLEVADSGAGFAVGPARLRALRARRRGAHPGRLGSWARDRARDRRGARRQRRDRARRARRHGADHAPVGGLSAISAGGPSVPGTSNRTPRRQPDEREAQERSRRRHRHRGGCRGRSGDRRRSGGSDDDATDRPIGGPGARAGERSCARGDRRRRGHRDRGRRRRRRLRGRGHARRRQPGRRPPRHGLQGPGLGGRRRGPTPRARTDAPLRAHDHRRRPRSEGRRPAPPPAPDRTATHCRREARPSIWTRPTSPATSTTSTGR